MYERYTQPARRAIYCASFHARMEGTPDIHSVHLLKGVTEDETSRANTLFCLLEHFPLYSGLPSRFATPEDVPARETLVANGMKRILAATVQEADMLGHYWIDTEHFVLGILKEGRSRAAEYLTRTGLTLNEARRAVKSSRPFWADEKPSARETPPYSLLGKLIYKWRRRSFPRENG